MTDHHPPIPRARLPQPASSATCAIQRRVTFVIPKTRAEASRVLDELKRRRPDPGADRRREIRAVQDDMTRDR